MYCQAQNPLPQRVKKKRQQTIAAPGLNQANVPNLDNTGNVIGEKVVLSQTGQKVINIMQSNLKPSLIQTRIPFKRITNTDALKVVTINTEGTPSSSQYFEPELSWKTTKDIEPKGRRCRAYGHFSQEQAEGESGRQNGVLALNVMQSDNDLNDVGIQTGGELTELSCVREQAGTEFDNVNNFCATHQALMKQENVRKRYWDWTGNGKVRMKYHIEYKFSCPGEKRYPEQITTNLPGGNIKLSFNNVTSQRTGEVTDYSAGKPIIYSE